MSCRAHALGDSVKLSQVFGVNVGSKHDGRAFNQPLPLHRGSVFPGSPTDAQALGNLRRKQIPMLETSLLSIPFYLEVNPAMPLKSLRFRDTVFLFRRNWARHP